MHNSIMRDRQRPLMKLYRVEPSTAWVTDEARTDHDVTDTLHGSVVIGPAQKHRLPVAVHSAVGGESDAPVPGDILAAALASCLDSTLRVVADRMGIALARLSVRVDAEVDVRGTLLLSTEVPVGFQSLTLHVDLALASGDEEQRQRLLQMAEHCCVVLRTLRDGVPVALRLSEEKEVGHVCA